MPKAKTILEEMILRVLNYSNTPFHLSIREYLGTLRHFWNYVRMILGVPNCTTTAKIEACEMVTPKNSAKMPDKL